MYMHKFVRLYNVRPKGVLHVGAHNAEEVSEYLANGFANQNPLIWVEAQPDLVKNLRSRLDPKTNKVYEAVAWNESKVALTFKVTSKTASSSVFDLGEHKSIYPDIDIESTYQVLTTRLDEVLSPSDIFDFLVLDIQGAEYEAIEGLGSRIKDVKWVYTEVSKNKLYKDAYLFKDIERLMQSLGFKRVFIAWDRRAGWGDALYVRKSIHKINLNQRMLIRANALLLLCRSYIPQKAFPVLVKIKRTIR